MKRRRSKSRGFSISEILVVMGIIGLMLMVGAPAWMNYRHTARFNTTVRQATAYIRQARHKAIERGRIYRISFATAATAEAAGTTPDGDGNGVADGREIQLWECTDPFGFTCSVIHQMRLDDSVFFFADGGHETFPDDDGDGLQDINFMPNGSVNVDDGDDTTEPDIYLRTGAEITWNQVRMHFGTAGAMETEKTKW